MCVEKKSKKLGGDSVGRKAFGDKGCCVWIMIEKKTQSNTFKKM